MDRLNLKGRFQLKHYRNGELLGIHDIDNAITIAGRNLLLDVMFGDGAKITTWCCGLISTLTALSEDDTMASHTGWSEYVNYDESARQTWGSGAASAASVTNATEMQFTINDSGGATIRALFITSDSTKSGVTGTLWSSAQFTSAVAVADNDVLKITYTLGAA